MFLEMLSKEQKELFMHLAVNATKANNSVEDCEKEMLLEFAQEMNVAPIISTDKKTDDVIDSLVGVCGNLEKKIILFEIVGIMLSDHECDETEKEFLNTLAKRFGIPSETVDNMIALVEDYTGLYNRIFDTVIRD